MLVRHTVNHTQAAVYFSNGCLQCLVKMGALTCTSKFYTLAGSQGKIVGWVDKIMLVGPLSRDYSKSHAQSQTCNLISIVVQDPELLSQQNQKQLEVCQTLSPSWGWGLGTRLPLT